MHPILKRIALNGGLTAALLAVLGLVFAEMAGMWLAGEAARPGTSGELPSVNASLRERVPLMMAVWGFAFVAVSELVMWRVRGLRKQAKSGRTAAGRNREAAQRTPARAGSGSEDCDGHDNLWRAGGAGSPCSQYRSEATSVKESRGLTLFARTQHLQHSLPLQYGPTRRNPHLAFAPK